MMYIFMFFPLKVVNPFLKKHKVLSLIKKLCMFKILIKAHDIPLFIMVHIFFLNDLFHILLLCMIETLF